MAPEEDVQTASLMALAAFPNLALTWADLDWLRARTDLPILAKGVLRGDDARLALEHGVDGIVVSNHGGRQVDGAIASLDALVEVRDEVGPDATVLMDGGIRRGADVLKALALGADAVLLGRLYAYGLAVGGAAGVEAVIRQLAAELDLTMALAGGTLGERARPVVRHLMPRLLRTILLPALLATILVATAAGGSSSRSATVKVAFLQGEQIVTVPRNGSTLRQAITALLAGPSAAERRREIASAVPRRNAAASRLGDGRSRDHRPRREVRRWDEHGKPVGARHPARAHSDVRQRREGRPAARQGSDAAGTLSRLRDVPPAHGEERATPDVPPPGEPAPEPTTDPTAAVRDAPAAAGRPLLPSGATRWTERPASRPASR